jgi:hypothetical protein
LSEDVAIEADLHLKCFIKKLKSLAKGGARLPVAQEDGNVFGEFLD